MTGIEAWIAITLINVGVSFSTAIFIAGAVVNIAGSLAINAVSGVLFGKSKSAAGGSLAADAQDRTRLIRSSAQPQRLLYGEAMVSGPLVFAETTGTDSEFLHLVIPLVGGEIEKIGSVFFNSKEIKSSDLDGSGNVISGDYSGKARIKKHLGADAQTADSDLVSEAVNWTTNHRLRGIAYLYVRLEHDFDVYPTGIPNIKARVRGLKVLDTRTSATIWTLNPAMCVRDFLTNLKGLNADATEIDDTSFNAAANVCDEMVTATVVTDTFTADAASDVITRSDADKKFATGDRLTLTTTGTLPAGLALSTNYFFIRNSTTEGKLATTYDSALAGTAVNITGAGAGTHTLNLNAHVRYDCNGTVDLDQSPIDVIEDMLTAAGAALVYTQGRYHLFAAAATTSSANIDTTWLRGPVAVQPKVPRRQLFNAVRGTFVDADLFWQPTDFAPVENASYETEDGGEQLIRDIELPYTTNNIRAQRIAKVHLEKSRQGITVELPCNFKALPVAVWDVVQLTISKFGWVNKEFRVLEWRLVDDLGINLVLQEESSAAYNWNAGNETTFDAAPDTILPDPFTAVAPTSLTLASGTAQLFVAGDGTVHSRVKAAWTAPASAFVKQGGHIEIEWKKTAAGSYEDRAIIRGSATEFFISPVDDGVVYDVRVRSINSFLVKSAFLTVTSHTVIGKTAAPADVSSFTIDGTTLSWVGPDSEVDLDGYEIRYHYGGNLDFDTAANLHTGVLKASPFQMEVVPAQSVTLLIKARDTSGNFSVNAAKIITNLGDALVANVVETFAQAPTWSDGTLSGGTIIGGEIVADDDGTLMWTSDTALMWASDGDVFWNGAFVVMSYEVSFTPSKAATGSGLTIPFTATGSSITIELRTHDQLMWSSDSQPMWVGDTLDMWNFPAYQPFAGLVVAKNEIYDLRVGTGAGGIDGVFSALTPTIDVPDIEESFSDVILVSGGSRLSLTGNFTVISVVNVTLQDDSGSAHTAIVKDKSVSLGPLIQALDTSGVGTSGTIDAIIQGY